MAVNPTPRVPGGWKFIILLVAIACAILAAVGAQWPATELKVLIWLSLSLIAFYVANL